MFRQKNSPEDVETPDSGSVEGKGRPTPSRKEAQARNARPLVGDRSKEARKAERLRMQEAREKARAGLARGDERYLSARDAGPQRRFVRDFVDRRWAVGEFLVPLMLLVLLATILLPPGLQFYVIISLWGYVLLAILDVIFANMRLGRVLRQKFGQDSVQRGWKWYAAMRTLQFRMLRLPKPQVKRGQKIK